MISYFKFLYYLIKICFKDFLSHNLQDAREAKIQLKLKYYKSILVFFRILANKKTSNM